MFLAKKHHLRISLSILFVKSILVTELTNTSFCLFVCLPLCAYLPFLLTCRIKLINTIVVALLCVHHSGITSLHVAIINTEIRVVGALNAGDCWIRHHLKNIIKHIISKPILVTKLSNASICLFVLYLCELIFLFLALELNLPQLLLSLCPPSWNTSFLWLPNN